MNPPHLPLLICLNLFGTLFLKAQSPCGGIPKDPKEFPQKGFEIVSILVDACDGNNEGENEMLRLVTGKQALLVRDFNLPPFKSGYVNWGNSSNPWRGFASSSSAIKAKLNTLNQQLSSTCGRFIFLSENDRIPPYSQVLFITSTDFNPYAHDFSQLQDTLYLIIQNAGNTDGHFVNYGSNATRTLILRNGNHRDTVIYNRSNLRQLNGNKGAEDGALVNFTFDGTAEYLNYGCKIPLPQFSLDAGADQTLNCDAQSVTLNAKISGFQCHYWSTKISGSGKFHDSTKALTRYYLPKNKPSNIRFYLHAFNACGSEFMDSITVTFPEPPLANWNIQTTSNEICFTNLSDEADYYLWRYHKNINSFDSVWGNSIKSISPCFPLDFFGGTLCLEASNSQNGCIDSICYSWNGKEPDKNQVPFIEIANTFTPGVKDGFNDELRVFSWGITQFEWHVFNRWGVEVFKSNNTESAWNGTIYNTGKECPSGSYFSQIIYQLGDGIVHQNSSVITLIR